MTEGILCLVAFSFLCWVVLLKAESAGTKEENKKLRAELERLVRKTTGDLDVVPGSRSWGKGKREMGSPAKA